jgi:hypothetical protein
VPQSKVALVRIFGETLKHEAIDDSNNLSRATEVTYESSVRPWLPSTLVSADETIDDGMEIDEVFAFPCSIRTFDFAAVRSAAAIHARTFQWGRHPMGSFTI